jgi:hypothetical protein
VNTKYKDDWFVYIIKSHESNHPNKSSTIKTAAKVAEGVNQSNENSDTKKEGIQHTKSKIGTVLKENIGKQSNAWPVCSKHT